VAKVTGTFSTFDSARNKEVFADTISMITPEETPLYSMIGTEDVSGVNPRWSLDSLATPSTSNARVQGDTYSFSAITATSKVANHTQIFMKEFIVAETQESVSKAGPKSDFNREKIKKGVELRTDIEVTIAFNQASVAAADTVAGKLGGLRAWIATNDSLGAGAGASGGYSSGTGLVVAATNGTQRTFTKALLDDNIQTVYQAGGNPTVLMVSPYLKRVFSSFMSDSAVAAFRTNMSGKKQGTIYGAADTYISDFGDIDVVPNRQWARVGATLNRNAFLLEPGKLAVGVLRGIQEDKEVAKTSDAKPGVLKAEVTLIVKNEAALGVIADLFGTTAST
jgi:hypothetical protein